MFVNVGVCRLANARGCLPGPRPVSVTASAAPVGEHPVDACTARSSFATATADRCSAVDATITRAAYDTARTGRSVDPTSAAWRINDA